MVQARSRRPEGTAMLATLPALLRDLSLPLRLRLWNGQQLDLGPEPQVTLIIKDPSLLAELGSASLYTLGSAYVEGRLELEGAMLRVIQLGDQLSEALLQDQMPPSLTQKGEHDRDSDAEAISYHYDLSNDFYALWLDSRMVYSCAYFPTGEEDLEAA